MPDLSFYGFNVTLFCYWLDVALHADLRGYCLRER